MLVERLPTLIVGGLTLLLAVWVFALRPRDRLHQAFALFLIARGGYYTFVGIDESSLSTWGRYAGYYAVSIPFAAGWLGFHLHRKFAAKKRGHQRGTGWIPWALLAGAAGMGIWLSQDFWLVIKGDWQGWFILPLVYLAYAAIGWLMIVEHARAPPGCHSSALLLLAVGFLIEPAYRASFMMLNLANAQFANWQILDWAIHSATVLVIVDSLRRLWGQARSNPELRARMPLVTGAMVVASVTGAIGFYGYNQWPGDGTLLLRNTLDAIWLLALVLVTVYAMLRGSVFNLEQRAKRIVTGSTLAAPFAAAFFVAGESLENWALETLGINSYMLGLAAAGSIGLGLFPLQRMARRLAERLFPGVDGSFAYQAKRRERMYQSAVEDAVDDRVITSRERVLLNEIRTHLDLSPAQARGLEKAVMASVLAAFPT